MIFLTGVAILVYFGFRTAAQSSGAIFNEAQSVSIKYGDSQSTGISPVCGCSNDLAYKEWRGITMIARAFGLDRVSGNSLKVYLVTPAVPSHVSWQPSYYFSFRPEIYRIYVKSLEDFDPVWLIRGAYPRGWHVTKFHADTPEPFIAFTSEDQLNVANLSDRPIVSWIPKRETEVTLAYSAYGAHANGMPYASIHEDILPCKDCDLGTEYPIVDVLGPNIVFWSADPGVEITNGREIIRLVPRTELDSYAITAVLIRKPPFSARIAIQSWPPDAWKDYTLKIQDPNKAPLIPAFPDQGGFADLWVTNPEQQAEDYREIRDKIKRNETVIIDDIDRYETYYFTSASRSGKAHSVEPKTKMSLDFRYPPLPETPGFGIFGAPTEVTLRQAVGKMWVGNRFVSVEAPSIVKLRKMSYFRSPMGIMSFPIPSEMKISGARIAIEKAFGEISINGFPASFEQEKLLQRFGGLEVLSVYFTVFGVIVAILAIGVPRVRRSRSE